MSAHSEQNIQDSSSKNPGSTAEGSDCVATHGKNENEVDDDWDDDWDAFQSLPASANDGVDSGEISLTTRYNEQTPPENSSHGSSSVDITAGAMEDITCVDKELEEPSDLQFSSTEQQAKHELPGSSHEDCDELERHPSVDCKEQLAHNQTADELPEVHEDIDQVIEDTKVVSAEIHGIEVDVHDDIVEDDSPINSNNLSDITEDESKGLDNASRVDGKFVTDDSREELSGSSDADTPDFSMSGNVMSESGGNVQLRG